MGGAEIPFLILAIMLLSVHVIFGYLLLKLKGHSNIWAYISLLLSLTPLFWFMWGCTTSKAPSKKTNIWTKVSLLYGVLGIVFTLLKQ
jgi:hypothetical protein